ncbi:GrpB family protein [Pseudarthrobacter sp. PS3-L1]|uniref:GrpB family protein n=1 Tax=Pseudarthrobacter sp. PS3-L1 TaxID=3046207 RepID=UPI0024BB1373|nr:GrpB family protein [Pseudarthrobacter sp. PS3-L1]MDJ0319053.1 GrpB family protein [Pseudarthrobacter sp. PS3-L1]
MNDISDEHLDAVLIGGRETRPIVVVDYDSAWPATYQRYAALVRAAVGDSVLLLEHIGSTSVPGLAAKPIIDMLLVVPVVEDEAAYLPALEDAGLVLRVRESGHRMFRTPERDVHLHLFSTGSPEIPRYLDFRDWLRTDTADRTLYESTKLTLATQEWKDMNYYSDAKSPVISEIMARARG